MPLPPSPNITLRARLIGPAGIVVSQLQVVANAFALTASDKVPQIIELGRGTPGPDGTLVIPVTLPGVLPGILASEVYPRIQLGIQEPRSRVLRVIAEIPAAPRGATIDFGVVEVRQESLFTIGDTTFFGFSKAVLDRLGAAASGTAAELQKQIDSLNEQLRQITAQLATATAQNVELQQTNASLRQASAAATAAAAAFQAQTEALSGQISQLNGRILQLNTQILQLNDQVFTVESQSRALAAERQTLQKVNTDLAAELTTAQQQRTAAEATIDDLKESINTRATLGSLVENVSTQLRSAQETLAGTGSPFKLGRLSMELKVLPSEHGTEFNFPTRDEVQRTSGDHLSMLSVDFTPVTPVELPGLPPAADVPDLTGATEVMARRLAAAAGYGLQTGFLAVPHAESGVSQAGRVVKQIPAPGDASAPGSIITVLLGKEE